LIMNIKMKFKKLMKRYGPDYVEVHRNRFRHTLAAEVSMQH
jgi:hypothetical protein